MVTVSSNVLHMLTEALVLIASQRCSCACTESIFTSYCGDIVVLVGVFTQRIMRATSSYMLLLDLNCCSHSFVNHSGTVCQ